MKWYWIIGYLLGVLSLSWTLGASPVQAATSTLITGTVVTGTVATITTSQPTLTVGDIVTLTVAVTHSAEAGIVPVAPARMWGAFEVRALSPVTIQTNGDGSATSRQEMGVTLWMTGTYGTPPLSVTLVDGEGKQQPLAIEPISLTVTSVLTGTDRTLRDLKAQATLPIPPLWPWLLGGAVGALLLGRGGWWLYCRWRARLPKAAVPTVLPDLRPAHQIALAELERIQQLQLPTQWRFKEHYTLTTDVLRRYLADAFTIPAIDQTTAEIRQALQQTTIPPEERSRLLALLNEADLVKFADVTPANDEAGQLLGQARAFVVATQATPATTLVMPASHQATEVTS